MRFIRQKTMRETDGMEVIFPLLPQMQVILDRIARKPQRGALVFDIIKEGMTETRIKEIVSCENANINARMENVAKLLGMEERPTPTWCRHSYATKLGDAGVSTEYISTMIGQNNVHFLHVNGVKKPVPFYNLDVIISVGYRVKSQRGVQFRQWANQVLKQYLIKGCSPTSRRASAKEGENTTCVVCSFSSEGIPCRFGSTR